MNDSSGWRLSRRGFLTGAAGVAVAAALPSSSRVRAEALLPSRARPSLAAPTAGATISPSTYPGQGALGAADLFDSYTSTSLAVTIQKFYATEVILAQTQLTSYMSQLSKAGCAFLVDLKPSRTLSSANQSGLSAWLKMLNKAGVKYRTVLYSEANNVAFATPQDWFTYWSFYAPVVKNAGVSCGYNPGMGTWAAKAPAYFPSNPTPDELWMDYYCTGFRVGSRLDQIIAQAQSDGVTGAGVAEWGWQASDHPLDPITIPWWDDYSGYLIHLANEGHINLGGIYFGSQAGGRTNNVINNSADPRVLMIQRVSAAFAAG
jgi:hypothetical protein